MIFVMSFVACGNNDINEDNDEDIVVLTKDNIDEYIQFDGEFTNGTYTMGITNYAEAILEFQAYPTVAGEFNNTEIVLEVTGNDETFTYMNGSGNYWHLVDADDTGKLEISFILGIDGNFSKNYSVTCSNNTGKLSGEAIFTVKSVSGTFQGANCEADRTVLRCKTDTERSERTLYKL